MSQKPYSEKPAAGPYASPQMTENYPPHAHAGHGDATGGVIPYKNMPALIAYYLGIASLIPCIGFAFAIPAFILGIVGLMKRKKNPEVKGSVHAWIGIVLGGGCTLLWGGLTILTVLMPILTGNV